MIVHVEPGLDGWMDGFVLSLHFGSVIICYFSVMSLFTEGLEKGTDTPLIQSGVQYLSLAYRVEISKQPGLMCIPLKLLK